MENCLISICVTSYNRVDELIRLLKSIDVERYSSLVEVVIAEDKSPRREDIKREINEFKTNSSLFIRDFYNVNNLGYDRNLGNLIKLAQGQYVIFCSDDDAFVSGALDQYIDTLLKYKPALAFSPFVNLFLKRKYKTTFMIPAGWENAAVHYNDSILFSGLTFRRSSVIQLDAEEFLNTYYFQVYMFLTVLSSEGCLYIDIPLVKAMSDGENGYGKSESSIPNEFLANRESVFSMLEFNKGLVKVIKLFDERNNSDVFGIFCKQYSVKSYYGLSRARHQGKDVYRRYVGMLDSLGVNFTWHNKVYRFMLSFLGATISDKIMFVPRQLMIKRLSLLKR